MALVTKPPIEHGIEIETAEGAIFRLDADQLKAQDIPSGLSFGTQRGDGFATCTFTLMREIFKNWPDLNLLDTVRVIARDGSIDWEGLIQSFPRTNDPQQLITVNCVGYMTSLKWRPMNALVIDRRLSSWVEPSLQRKSENVASFQYGSFSASSGSPPGLQAQVGQVPFTNPIAEAWFYGGGNDLTGVLIKATVVGFAIPDASLFHLAGSSQDDLGATLTQTDLKASNGTRTLVGFNTTGKKWANLQVAWLGSGGGTTGKTYGANWEEVAVLGLTYLTLRNEEGFYLTDIIQYLLARFGSKLTWEGEENRFILAQCTWHDNPQTPYDAIQQLNNYVLWETNVWEERKFHFEPADLTEADWQIRTSDPGVTVNFQGDSIESFASGVMITYSDFFGHTYTLMPEDHPELRDENENNAASRHGVDIFISYTIPDRCLEDEALQFGSAYLAQNNRPKRPGSFTVIGHIQDSAGHWHRASEVRNSQALSVVDDLYEGEPRLITATTYDEESAALTITVDAPPMTIEAIVARNTLALEARNLTG